MKGDDMDTAAIPSGTHFGVAVDDKGFYRATVLRNYARAPEFIGPKFKTPREAITYSDTLESQHGEA